MIRAIIAASMRFRWIVVATALSLMVAGLTQLYHMPVDVFPEFAPPLVEIQTPSSGLFPEEVEALVTVPLEQAMAGLPRLHVMRSKSVAQLSSIMLEFERGTNLTEARQLVQERIALVLPTLPTWAAPPVMLPPLSASRRVMRKCCFSCASLRPGAPTSTASREMSMRFSVGTYEANRPEFSLTTVTLIP